MHSLAINEVEASKLLGISVSSLRKARMNGKRMNRMVSPPYVRLGRRVLYLFSDLESWIKIHRVDLNSRAGREGEE